ncbi:GATA zinc finger domain containing 2Ab [Chanos chanos]|uniref:GATA zinc finger domain containing 2Ab n=1 Tax=Chanos chanos TaxID=29144 RepID=A0A6J2WAA0_CHACN|nr:transcriptional repressor p66-alpha-like [Chanos chanos]
MSSEDAVRQTRSQKRALEREAPPVEVGDSKKVKLEKGELGYGVKGSRAEQVNRVASFLKAGEVKATIKVEVQTNDEPVDMTTSKTDVKKEKRPPSPDDVIVLSDNEPSSPCMNGDSHSFKKTDTELLMKSSPKERERIIKQLKEELRLQEAKLVLLKKLRQSQIQKDSSTQKPVNSVATPPALVRGSISAGKGSLQVAGRSSGTVIPPPLVRGGTQVSSKVGSQNTIVMPPLVRGAQPIAVTPAQIQSLRQQQQLSGSVPPPLLLGPRTSVPNVQVQGQRIIQQGLIRVANVPNTNVVVNIPQASPTSLKGSSVNSQSGLGTNASLASVNDSPASRQAAAKLALRKQLEKTLLEIPPPKPPAPELNFLPSAANNEFIYLVGLEEVVQNLLDTLAKGKQQGEPLPASTPAVKDPFTCSQCQTDFTSRWRKDKAGSILCEGCMSSNQKKALKAEHTGRLRAAFVKALQQEQEIEQCILPQAASPISKTSSSSSSSSSSGLTKTEQHVLVSGQYKQGHSALSQQHLTNRTTPTSRYHSTVKQLQTSVPAAALLSRQGKHALPLLRAAPKVNSSASSSNSTASAWKKQNTATAAGVTMSYVNPSLSVHKAASSTAAVDRQREYLLDMIPPRSLSQTANTWK